MDIISIIAYTLLGFLMLVSLFVIIVYSLQSKSLEWTTGLMYLRDQEMISDVDLEREVRNPPWYVALSDRIFYIQQKIGND